MTSALFPTIKTPLARQSLAVLAHEVQQVRHALRGQLPNGASEPPDIIAWLRRVQALDERLASVHSSESTSIKVSLDDAALLRTAVSLHRRRLAESSEQSEQLFHNASVRSGLTSTFAEQDSLLAGALAEIVPDPRPRLGDYFTVEGLENSAALGVRADRERDPKHRILLSSSILRPDIGVFRRSCEERRVRLGVLFADLDYFKKVNDALGEVVVDRTVLPQVLGAVERAAFGQAEAYRHGGDEFVLLLPNTSAVRAAWVADELRQGISALPMPPGVNALSASVGIWIAEGESHLTDNELVQRASEAKSRAKQLGRGRVVVWDERGSARTETVFPEEA